MSFFRLVSPGLRAGLLVAVGSMLLAVPFALGLSVAAIVVGVGVGILAIGLGLAGTASEGRGTLPLSAHAAYDLGLALGLVFAAVAFGAGGEAGAALFFFVVGLVQLTLSAVTRYSAGPATPSFLQ